MLVDAQMEVLNEVIVISLVVVHCEVELLQRTGFFVGEWKW